MLDDSCTAHLQGFLTGVLQQHARKHNLAIDTLSFETRVTEWTSVEQITAAPEDGVLIHGLYLESGQWNSEQSCLSDAESGIMHSEMPIIHLRPIQTGANDERDQAYSCPLYKTTQRAGALSTTGQSTNHVATLRLPMDPNTSEGFWILRATALICALDD